MRCLPKMLTAGRMPFRRSVASANSAIIANTRAPAGQGFSISSGASSGGIFSQGSFSCRRLRRGGPADRVTAARAAAGGLQSTAREHNSRRGCAPHPWNSSSRGPSRALRHEALLLVDASSYLYRAFHALPDLRNKAEADRRHLRRAQHAAPAAQGRRAQIIARAYSTPRAGRSATASTTSTRPTGRRCDELGAPDRAAAPASVRSAGSCWRSKGGGRRRDRRRSPRSPSGVAHGDLVRATRTWPWLVNGSVVMMNTMSNETFDEAAVAAKFGCARTRSWTTSH